MAIEACVTKTWQISRSVFAKEDGMRELPSGKYAQRFPIQNQGDKNHRLQALEFNPEHAPRGSNAPDQASTW